MWLVRTEAPRGLRWGAFGLASLTLLTLSYDPVDARSRHRHVSRRHTPAFSYQPRYSDIVVDGNTGGILHASNPDAERHPASLTKVMTLYLLFERLDAGRIKLDSPLQVSAHAADQSPTKLGLRAGQTIQVEDAIKGVVTRSANDAAVVIAENLGGDESTFAKLMTRKAQALGMSHTVYRNASGLPDDDQVTTARDQALLGRAIQERFPRYYRFFSTRSFTFRGETIGNHNHLLGSVEGVDGIKTGYIRASGFNLITSLHRDNRYLVAVVMGGSSAGSRDSRMRQLISDHIAEASSKRTASIFAEADARRESKPEIKAEAKPDPKPAARSYALAGSSRPAPIEAATVQQRMAAAAPRAAAGSASDPIRPVLVKTLSVKPGAPVQTASAAVASLSLPAFPVEPRAQAEPPLAATPPDNPAPPAATVTGSIPVPASAAPLAAPDAVATPTARPAQAHSGWIIQVGAYTVEHEAKQRLAAVQSKASRLLASAAAFTESVLKGETTYYRARFAGLGKEQAEAACKYLKRNDVECLTIKN
jgi:D-alanyl-D-alanine carboxypeptidase